MATMVCSRLTVGLPNCTSRCRLLEAACAWLTDCKALVKADWKLGLSTSSAPWLPCRASRRVLACTRCATSAMPALAAAWAKSKGLSFRSMLPILAKAGQTDGLKSLVNLRLFAALLPVLPPNNRGVQVALRHRNGSMSDSSLIAHGSHRRLTSKYQCQSFFGRGCPPGCACDDLRCTCPSLAHAEEDHAGRRHRCAAGHCGGP